jgi:predicted metal-dependent peptidase
MSLLDSVLTPEEKIKIALDWVAKQEPWVIPTVLTRWAVVMVSEQSDCPTMQTDGRRLEYNTDFVARLSLSATKAIVLHEVGHVISQHNHRRDGRNPKGWNIACDLALNCLLFRGYLAAFNGDVDQLHAELIHPDSPSCGCFVGFGSFADLPHNKSAEEYYDILKSRNPQPPKGDGEGDGEGEGDGSRTNPSRGRGRGRKPADDEPLEEGTWDDVFNGDSDSDDGEGKGKGKGKGQTDTDTDTDTGSGEESGEGEGEGKGKGGKGKGGEGIDPSDFADEDGDADGDVGEGSKGGPLNSGKDPFADLPDPTETFGGGVEDAPIEATLREDEAALILETLLGGDSYGSTGLGDVVSKYRERVEGDPEVAAQVNWRRELERFLRVQHAAGWKYDRPSRRHSHRADVVLPARRARNKTRGLLIVDTSASMGDHECEQAIAHLGKILGLFPQSTVTLAMCDTAVRSSAEYRACDFPIREFEGWKGRGSTDLKPAFKWAKQNKARFDWVIVVSDMEWDWWQSPDPSLPVLWVNTRTILWQGGNYHVPFGKLVNFHAQQHQK